LALIWIVSPVAGFRPTRGLRSTSTSFGSAILTVVAHNGIYVCFPISSQTSEAIFT
jgi:hypothetical protein